MSRPVPPMSLKEAREVLGVGSDSTPQEVRRAFRAAAKRAHPDRGGDEAAFRRILEAYQRLQDPLDERLTQPAPRARPAAEPSLEIPPRVAIEGGVVEHVLPDGRPVRIRLPAGLRSGDVARAAGIEFRVYVRAEGGVLVRGDDLWMSVKVAPSTLKKGGRVSLETPIGRRTVWINRKAAERGLVRLEGQGLPARGRHPRGHLFVRLTAGAAAGDSVALALLRRFAAAWAA